MHRGAYPQRHENVCDVRFDMDVFPIRAAKADL
jgi:hypothetical protein